jgi:mono/diheme cytochrome c family protein
MKMLIRLVVAFLALAGLAAIGVVVWLGMRGIGTRSDPPAIEVSIARSARRFAIPAADRARPNPILATKGSIREGLEHWADHCASCHGNDGSGDTPVGGALYPRTPDLRQRPTQELQDGELFYIIENGVKLTGMAAWGTGTPEGEQASWHLVNFIRHLPQLSDEELAEMADLNPRGPAEWRALEEERRFLAGETDAPPAPVKPTHEHKGGHE